MPSFYIVLEKNIPNLDIHVNGKLLAKKSGFLESVARKIGVAPLFSFFSVSRSEVNSFLDAHGESVECMGITVPTERWFSAEEGLNTVRELVSHLEKLEPSESELTISNLKEFERVLEAANQAGVRWHLAIDY
ncbi:MAG TPA: hypothetical protein VNH65_19855 [Candidatus Acidoferrum sp.]|nr:hypothetical protein [Candidatus Acidoferrum sp.]